MVRPVVLALSIALAAGCTVPQFDCGRPVPCARGSVQSCISHDHSRCRYRFDDGTTAECSSCEDCFAAERQIIAWCGGDDPLAVGGNGGGGGGGGGDAPAADMSAPGHPAAGDDLAPAVEPADFATPSPGDLARPPLDFSSATPDLGCYGWTYECNADPDCCAHCCAGGCAQVGWCAMP